MTKFLLTILILIGTAFDVSFSQYGHWEELILEKYPPARCDFGMSGIGENKVIIFGGSGGHLLNDTWIFDLNEKRWTEIILDSLPQQRRGHKLARLNINKVILFGGWGDLGDLNDTWIFDLDSLKWIEVFPDNIPEPRDGYSLSQVTENIVLMFGGNKMDDIHIQEPWIYNFVDNTWTIAGQRIGHLPGARESGLMTQISDNKVLLFGGWACKILDDIWIFDYNGEKYENFNQIFPNDIPITNNSAIAKLNDNIVMLFGGSDPNGSAELYNGTYIFNLETNSWSILELNLKPPGRWLHELAYIKENTVLLFGWYNDTWLFELDSSFIDVSENTNEQSQIKTFVNSNKELILDYYLTESRTTEIDIYNISGILLFKSVKQPTQNGWTRELIPVDNFPVGLYFVRVSAGTKLLFDKFLVY